MVPEVPAAGAEGVGSGPVVRFSSLPRAAHPAPSRPGDVREQHVGPSAAQQGAQVQATCHGEQPGPGGSDPGLHEPAGNDLQHVRPHAQVEVVCLDCCLLFLHQLCQLSKL